MAGDPIKRGARDTTCRRRGMPGALVATLALTVFAALGGCATWPAAERPVVAVGGIEPIDVGFLSQQYRMKLRVLNRAATPLELRGVVFDVAINGEPFAKGAGPVSVSVPGYEATIVEANAISTLSSVARQLRGLASAVPALRLSYRITGRFDLADGGSVPFDDRGELSP